LKVPEAVGVPLMVIVFEAQDAVTPAGRPVGIPMPVAPVVVCVSRLNAVFTHRVGVPDGEETVLGATVLSGVIMIVPVADTVPQPPVKGML
jgi:hypothetical protein